MKNIFWWTFVTTSIVLLSSMVLGFFIGCKLMENVQYKETAIIKEKINQP